MIYAHIDENNILLGWYDTDIHDTIPTPNVEVTQQQWQNALDNEHNKVNADGSTEFVDIRSQEEKDEWNATEYQRNRASEYPPLAEQLDYIYHNGIEAWKADMILPVKNKYPKGSE